MVSYILHHTSPAMKLILVEHQFVKFRHILCIEGWDWVLFRGLGCWDSVDVVVVSLLCVLSCCCVCLCFVFDVWSWVVFCNLVVLVVFLLDWCWWVLWLWSCEILLCGGVVLCGDFWWVCFLYCYDVCVVCVCVVCGLFLPYLVVRFDSVYHVVDVSFWGFSHEVIWGWWGYYTHGTWCWRVWGEIYYLNCFGVA